MQDLKKGQFIDTYRGEIITHEEANKRHQNRTVDQEIYLMDLDKWTEEDGAAQYVCDGMHVSGPTRFINHSCDPNCAIYTVSYNHADINIYEIAFFATQAIPRGTGMCFASSLNINVAKMIICDILNLQMCLDTCLGNKY